MQAAPVLESLWRSASMPESRLDSLSLTGADPVLPSSFAVGTAAQASMAAAALAALEIGSLRGAPPQQVSVDMREAALECCGHFTLDGRAPDIWDKIAGLYACGANGERGWVRLHTNFAQGLRARRWRRRCAPGAQPTSNRRQLMPGWSWPLCAASRNGTSIRMRRSSLRSPWCRSSASAMRRPWPGRHCRSAHKRCEGFA